MIQTYAGTEYAIRFLNGQVPRSPINETVLREALNTYVLDVIGRPLEMQLRSHQEPSGVTVPNYQLFLVGYIDY